MVYQDLKKGSSSLLGNSSISKQVSDRKITSSYRNEYENAFKKESFGVEITIKDSLVNDISMQKLMSRENTRSQLMQRKGLNDNKNNSDDYMSAGDEI